MPKTFSMGSSWENSILTTLFTIFVIAIIFGVLLIAITATNTAIATAGTTQTSSYNIASANAPNDLAANAIVLTSGGTISGFPNVNQPVTITLTGNVITSYATNTAFAQSTASLSEVFVADSPTNTLTLTGNFFNITSIKTSGVPTSQTGNYVATITQTFGAAVHGSAPWTNTVNSIIAIHVHNVTNSSTVNIGNSGENTLQVFTGLVGYLVTLANFVGIIILLSIIVVVVAVLYMFFKPQSNVKM